METKEPTEECVLDAARALRLVSAFFDQEWAQTDLAAVHTRKITGGLINSLQLIWRDNAANIEPPAVLIRHFGQSGEIEEPAGSSLTLSSTDQAIVYWEMGRRGWGPKVYGSFPGGRLEEYIESHTLTAAEATHPSIIRDVARSYARLHSLQLPLRKDNFTLIRQGMSHSVRSKREHVMGTLLAINHPIAEAYAAMFGSVEWAQELNWLAALFAKHNCKATLTHGDANYLNILVRDASSASNSDSRIALVDYETVAYGYRGVDIGGHFNERMYCYNQPDTQLTGYEAYDVEEQRVFCEAYLQELRNLGVEMSATETVEQLILEARIGRMYQILVTNLMCTVFDEVEVNPLFLSGLLHMMETYGRLKAEFEDGTCM